MILSYAGIGLGYLNKGILFLIILSTEQIGLINLIITVGLLFAQMANFGAVFTTWKFLPFFKNKERKHHGFLALMLGLVLFGIIVCLTVLILFRDEIQQAYLERSAEFVDYYYWVIPVGIGYVLFMVLEAYLRGFYKNIISVISYEIVLRLGVTLTLISFAMQWINFGVFIYLNSILYLIPPVILLVYLARSSELYLSPANIRVSRRFRKIIFSFSGFNYINTLGAVVIASLDVIMIAQMVGLEATGVYTTIIFLSSVIQVPYRSIIRISSPLVADYWKHREMDKMKDLYTRVSSVSLMIALSTFIYLWLNIDLLFSFLKPEFQSGIWVFLFLMMGRMLDMYFGLNGPIFSTSKKFRYDIIFTVVLMATVYLLNLWFIPIWGIAGAAISTGLSLVVYNVGRLIFVWYIFRIHPFERNQFIIIGIGLVTLFAGIGVGRMIENGWVQLVAETILFGILFLFPVYKFNLEKNTVDFLKNGSSFVRSKLRGGSNE